MSQSQLGSVLQRARVLQPGDKLGKHDLIRQIAIGGMAELYLARSFGIEGFEKLVVVKRILPQYADNAGFVSMFLNEARLAATLHHPNIAQVYDIGQESGEYFFSMEYVHGVDLGRLIASSNEQGVPISLDVALTLISGLCAGLHHAHEQLSSDGAPLNIVHRDISPSNVLVSYDGGVKLVDFGIARASGRPTTTVSGGLKGKIAYMSPEQCRGTQTLDRRSDLFSVGMLLYELTTGHHPFSSDSEYGLLNRIVNEDVPPPTQAIPGYPPQLETIVMRALQRDPELRFASARDLQGQLEDFAHDNRLRVSPLVLARLMESLFPERREQWDAARTQGAFFVEQHVVRTLTEKSGAIEQPPAHVPAGTPFPRQGPPGPMRPAIPNAVPILPIPQPGTLFSSSVSPPVRPPLEETVQVRVSTQHRSRSLVIGVLGCALAASIAITIYIATRDPELPAPSDNTVVMEARAKSPAIPDPAPAATKTADRAPDPPPSPPPTTQPTPAPPPPEPPPPVSTPDLATAKPPIKAVAPKLATKPTTPKPATKRPPRPRPKAKTDPAPPNWNSDSPFMPVRPSKP